MIIGHSRYTTSFLALRSARAFLARLLPVGGETFLDGTHSDQFIAQQLNGLLQPRVLLGQYTRLDKKASDLLEELLRSNLYSHFPTQLLGCFVTLGQISQRQPSGVWVP